MTPSAHRTKCEICGNEINIREPGTHQWTSGWVMVREGGGGHGISCAERSPRWAHRYCVDRMAKGFIKQGTLL